MFFDLPDPDHQYLYGSEYGSFHHQAKIVRKPLISNFLGLLYEFLSLKNDVNVPQKVGSKEKLGKILFLLAS
jgi:hypothetical protein